MTKRRKLTVTEAWVLAHLAREGEDWFIGLACRRALKSLEKSGYVEILTKAYYARITSDGRKRLLE